VKANQIQVGQEYCVARAATTKARERSLDVGAVFRVEALEPADPVAHTVKVRVLSHWDGAEVEGRTITVYNREVMSPWDAYDADERRFEQRLYTAEGAA